MESKKTSNSNSVKERKKTSSVCNNCSTVQTFCWQCQEEYKKNMRMKPWQKVGFCLGFGVGLFVAFLIYFFWPFLLIPTWTGALPPPLLLGGFLLIHNHNKTKKNIVKENRDYDGNKKMNNDKYTMSNEDIRLLFGKKTPTTEKRFEEIIINFVNSCVQKKTLILEENESEIDKNKLEFLKELHINFKKDISKKNAQGLEVDHINNNHLNDWKEIFTEVNSFFDKNSAQKMNNGKYTMSNENIKLLFSKKHQQPKNKSKK